MEIRNPWNYVPKLIERHYGVRVGPVDGEAFTLGQIVAMHKRGQDISLYVRPIGFDADGDPTHDSLSFHEVQNMDFTDRHELIEQQRMTVASFKAQQVAELAQAKAKAEADAAALAAAKEEHEKAQRVSRSKKYSKDTDDSNDE